MRGVGRSFCARSGRIPRAVRSVCTAAATAHMSATRASTPRCRKAPTRTISRSKPPSSCSRRSVPRAGRQGQAGRQTSPPRAQDRLREGGVGTGCSAGEARRRCRAQPTIPGRGAETHDKGERFGQESGETDSAIRRWRVVGSHNLRPSRRPPKGGPIEGGAHRGAAARNRAPAGQRTAVWVDRCDTDQRGDFAAGQVAQLGNSATKWGWPGRHRGGCAITRRRPARPDCHGSPGRCLCRGRTIRLAARQDDVRWRGCFGAAWRGDGDCPGRGSSQ